MKEAEKMKQPYKTDAETFRVDKSAIWCNHKKGINW